MRFRIVNGGRLSFVGGRVFLNLGVIQPPGGSPQIVAGGSPPAGSPPVDGGSPPVFGSPAANFGDFLLGFSFTNTMYDEANDVLFFSAKKTAIGSPSGGSPDDRETSWIFVSQDGGITFDATRVDADSDEAVSKFFFFNNVTDSEYLAIAQDPDDGPKVYFAAYADPTTWTLRHLVTEGLDPQDAFIHVAYDGSRLVALLDHGFLGGSPHDDLYVLYSDDAGASWTFVDYDEENMFVIDTISANDYSWEGLEYDGTHFVATASAFDQNSSAMWSSSSTDGVTWSDTLIANEGFNLDMATDETGTVIAISYNGNTGEITTYETTDHGATWNAYTTLVDFDPNDFTFTLYSLAYDAANARYVFIAIFDNTADHVYSWDGAASPKVWTKQFEGVYSTESVALVHLANGYDKFMAGGFFLWQFDDAFQNLSYFPMAITATDIAWVPFANKFIVTGIDGDTGAGVIFSSDDGINWVTAYREDGGVGGFRIIVGTSTVVVMRDSPLTDALASTDLITWTPSTYSDGGIGFDGVFAEGLFVIAGESPTFAPNYREYIATSPDGLVWTTRQADDIVGLSGAAYIQHHNGQFVVMTGAGNVLSSLDGLSWTIEEELFDPAAQGGMFTSDTEFMGHGSTNATDELRFDGATVTAVTITAGTKITNGGEWDGTNYIYCGVNDDTGATGTWTSPTPEGPYTFNEHHNPASERELRRLFCVGGRLFAVESIDEGTSYNLLESTDNGVTFDQSVISGLLVTAMATNGSIIIATSDYYPPGTGV